MSSAHDDNVGISAAFLCLKQTTLYGVYCLRSYGSGMWNVDGRLDLYQSISETIYQIIEP